MRVSRLIVAVAAGGVFASVAGLTAAWAGVPEAQIARLGQDLTPMGAEQAGNADGSIPAWTGGLTSAPDGIGFKGRRPFTMRPKKTLRPLLSAVVATVFPAF